jgi:outer membrane protein insertion porin family
MKLAIALALILGMLPATSAHSQETFVFGGWKVVGGELKPDDLRRLFPWSPGDSIPAAKIEDAERTLRDALIGRGFWNASVDVVPSAEQAGRRIFEVQVAGGEAATVDEISLVGNRIMAREEIMALLDIRPGQRMDSKAMRDGIQRVLRAYSERGYPLARVYPGRFRREADGRLVWILQVGEGPETRVEEVRAKGETSTSPEVLGRIAGVQAGSLWDARRIDEIAPRLRREDLFLSVGEPRIVRGSHDNLLRVEIDVEEGKSSSILGVLGYVPTAPGEGEVVGLIDLRLGNIMGTARRAEFHFERQASESRDLAFRYREPWILGSPVAVEVGAAQALRDTLYSRTDLDLAVSVPIGWRARAELAGERRESSLEGVDGREISTGGSVALSADHRDRRLNPSRGMRGALRIGLRNTNDDITRTRVETGLGVYLPFGSRWVIAEEGGFEGVWATSKDVPISDQYNLGGTNTLRGYREEQFHGDIIWWVRNELRYRLTSRSRAYSFADVGGYQFDETDPLGVTRQQDDVLAGGGVGIALETRSAGMLRVEIAVGRGDGFSDAKVHAALEQEF